MACKRREATEGEKSQGKEQRDKGRGVGAYPDTDSAILPRVLIRSRDEVVASRCDSCKTWPYRFGLAEGRADLDVSDGNPFIVAASVPACCCWWALQSGHAVAPCRRRYADTKACAEIWMNFVQYNESADGHMPALRTQLCIVVGGHDNVDTLRRRTKEVKSLSQRIDEGSQNMVLLLYRNEQRLATRWPEETVCR